MTVAREACSIALGDCTGHSIRPSRDRRPSTRFEVAARMPSGSARRFAVVARMPSGSARRSAVRGRGIPTSRRPARSLLAFGPSGDGDGAGSDRRAGHDLASPGRVRREHPVIAYERIARWRHQRCKSRQQLDGRHHPMLRSTSTELLDPIGHTATGKQPESLERERRTRAISAEPLTTRIIFGSDADARVEIEAVMLYGASFAGWSIRVETHGFSRTPASGRLRERAHRPSLRRDRRASFHRGREGGLI